MKRSDSSILVEIPEVCVRFLSDAPGLEGLAAHAGRLGSSRIQSAMALDAL